MDSIKLRSRAELLWYALTTDALPFSLFFFLSTVGRPAACSPDASRVGGSLVVPSLMTLLLWVRQDVLLRSRNVAGVLWKGHWAVPLLRWERVNIRDKESFESKGSERLSLFISDCFLHACLYALQVPGGCFWELPALWPPQQEKCIQDVSWAWH